MTNTQKAQDTRNVSVCECLVIPANAAIYESDVPLSTIAAKMIADTAAAVAAGAAAAADNTGYSLDKVIAKDAVAAMGANLCDRCIVKLNLLGNNALAKSLNGAETFYSKAADALCVSRLTNVYTIMNNNLTLITADYLTAAQLTTFSTAITDFSAMRGSTVSVNDNSPVLTKAYATAMKLTSADVVIIKSLLKFYKLSHPLFYASMMKACKMPAITVRHTPVVINVFNAITTAGLSGAESMLTKSKEVLISNFYGVIKYTKVSAGFCMGTISKPDYISKVIPMEIIRGATNTFNVALVPGIMTAEQEEAIQATIAQVRADEKAAIAEKKKAKKDAKVAAALKIVPEVTPTAIAASVIAPTVEAVVVAPDAVVKKTRSKIAPIVKTVVEPPAEGGSE